jgi:signal transduction histidine kinase
MEGKITGLSIIMINIEKEKQHEEAIDFQTKTFSEIARLQSHDIRMPLTNILSLINLMNLEECPPLQKEYLNLLQESANRLDKVINEIVFKADKGRSILSQLEKKSI